MLDKKYILAMDRVMKSLAMAKASDHRLYNSRLEGYATIKIKFDKLWGSVMHGPEKDLDIDMAVELASTVIRYIAELNNGLDLYRNNGAYVGDGVVSDETTKPHPLVEVTKNAFQRNIEGGYCTDCICAIRGFIYK